DRGHLVHRDAEGAIAGEADHRDVRVADLGANDRREAVATGAKQARGQVLPPAREHRVGIADGAVVADVARDDGIRWQRSDDGPPRLPRRHVPGLARPALGVPHGAGVVSLMVELGERLRPAALVLLDLAAALTAAGLAGLRLQLGQ